MSTASKNRKAGINPPRVVMDAAGTNKKLAAALSRIAPLPEKKKRMIGIDTKILKALAASTSDDHQRESITYIAIEPLENDEAGTLFVATDGRSMLFYQHTGQRLGSVIYLQRELIKSLKGKRTDILDGGGVNCDKGIHVSAITKGNFPYQYPNYRAVMPPQIGKPDKIGLIQARFMARFVRLAEAMETGDPEMLKLTAKSPEDPHLVWSEPGTLLGLVMPYRINGTHHLQLPAWLTGKTQEATAKA
jgi:hypothetical protein